MTTGSAYEPEPEDDEEPAMLWTHRPGDPAVDDADLWSEVTGPDDPDYLRGTAMRDRD